MEGLTEVSLDFWVRLYLFGIIPCCDALFPLSFLSFLSPFYRPPHICFLKKYLLCLTISSSLFLRHLYPCLLPLHALARFFFVFTWMFLTPSALVDYKLVCNLPPPIFFSSIVLDPLTRRLPSLPNSGFNPGSHHHASGLLTRTSPVTVGFKKTACILDLRSAFRAWCGTDIKHV